MLTDPSFDGFRLVSAYRKGETVFTVRMIMRYQLAARNFIVLGSQLAISGRSTHPGWLKVQIAGSGWMVAYTYITTR
jgi:hypothetical protein